MSILSPSYQQSVFKHYHSDKYLSEFYLQDGDKNQLYSIDMEQNYVTVTLCKQHPLDKNVSQHRCGANNLGLLYFSAT